VQLDREIDALFARWSAELDDIEARLGPPAARPFTGTPGPGQAPGEAWQSEMNARTRILEPIALEMASAYIAQLDDEQRRRAQAMIAERVWVCWQFPRVISDAFARALDSLAGVDLDAALALIAIHDDSANSRDFSRMLHPFVVGLQQKGLDAAAVFRDRQHLVTAHDDPERGAQAVFARCAK
jgi:hypothetical protein